jgi:predicted regulator of Ras-like GTPase activity (Roadblock/LC7/MglB family)
VRDTSAEDLRAPAALPVRKASPPAHDAVPPKPAMVQSAYDVAAISEALGRIRGTVDCVVGLLVATRDGLVLSGETSGVENDSVAAMAAAAAGLATQFTAQAKVGEPRATMFEGINGYVCVFPVEATLLLVVFGEPDITMGLFNVAAKQALAQLHQVITGRSPQVAGPPAWPDSFTAPK